MELVTKACLEMEAFIQDMPDEENRQTIYIRRVEQGLDGVVKFLMRGSTKEMNDIIQKVERETSKACEKCGSRGEWVFTRTKWGETENKAFLCRDEECRPPHIYPPAWPSEG